MFLEISIVLFSVCSLCSLFQILMVNKVIYLINHVGHSSHDLSGPKITLLCRKFVIKRLFSDEKIIDNVRLKYVNATSDYYVNQSDILNIEASIKLNNIYDPNNAISVNAIVDKIKNMSSQFQLLLFNPQGQIATELPGLKEDDFILAFTSEVQLNYLKEKGNSSLIIDATHGTNAYKFNLTILLVHDSTDLWFPRVYLISQRVERANLVEFFSSPK